MEIVVPGSVCWISVSLRRRTHPGEAPGRRVAGLRGMWCRSVKRWHWALLCWHLSTLGPVQQWYLTISFKSSWSCIDFLRLQWGSVWWVCSVPSKLAPSWWNEHKNPSHGHGCQCTVAVLPPLPGLLQSDCYKLSEMTASHLQSFGVVWRTAGTSVHGSSGSDQVRFGYQVRALVTGTSLSHYHLWSTMHCKYGEEENSTGLGVAVTSVCQKVGELCGFHRVQRQTMEYCICWAKGFGVTPGKPCSSHLGQLLGAQGVRQSLACWLYSLLQFSVEVGAMGMSSYPSAGHCGLVIASPAGVSVASLL